MRAQLALLAFLSMCCGSVQAQVLDTALIFFNARMLLLTDGYEMSMRPQEEVQGFIDGTWRYGYHLVPATGYPANYVFCAMTNEMVTGLQVPDTASVRIRLNHRVNTKFLVAINTSTKQMFKLEGFKCLDEMAFRMDVVKYTSAKKERRFILRKKRFPAHYTPALARVSNPPAPASLPAQP